MPATTRRPFPRPLPLRLCVALALALTVASAHANDRAFTFSYESSTMAPGQVELEQWTTWKTDKRSDHEFDRLDFRHEVEFGVTDRLQLAAYFDWRYEDGASVRNDGTDIRDVALEAIYSLTHPVTDFVGSALYAEVKRGKEFFEVEAKVILDKKVDVWTVAWNGILEAEWEDSGLRERKGKLAETAGVSYSLCPEFAVGAELLHELEIDDWEEFEKPVVYAGPNVSWRMQRFWTTLTPMLQLTSNRSEPDFQVRWLVGFHF